MGSNRDPGVSLIEPAAPTIPLDPCFVAPNLHDGWPDDLVIDFTPVAGDLAQQHSILEASTPQCIHLSVRDFAQASDYKHFWYDQSHPPMVAYEQCVICGATMAPVSAMANQQGQRFLTLGLCLDCGFLQHIRRPPRAWYADFYRSMWDPAKRTEAAWPQQLAPRIETVRRAMTSVRAGCRVLEIGCGWGGLIATYKHLGFDCYGVEATPHRSEFIRRRLAIPCLTGEAELLPLGTEFLQPEHFDLIVSTNVLEHVYNTREVLERAHALLRPEGLLYVEIPNYYQENLTLNTHGVAHTCNFSFANFLYLLQTIGFDMVRDYSDFLNIRYLVRKAPPFTPEQRQSKLAWMKSLLPYRGLAHVLEKNGLARIPATLQSDMAVDFRWTYRPGDRPAEVFMRLQFDVLRQWAPLLHAIKRAIGERAPLETIMHLLPILYVYRSDSVPVWYY